MKVAKMGACLSTMSLLIGLAGCGSTEEPKGDDSATTYSLSGTYRAATTAVGTRFAQLSFTDGSDKFTATKANCSANCDIAGTFVMNALEKRLTLSHDGLVESIAFVADPSRGVAIRAKGSSPASSALRPSTLQARGLPLDLDLSIHLQCGTVRPKPGGTSRTPAERASAGDDGSLLAPGGDPLLQEVGKEVARTLLKSFEVEDETTPTKTASNTRDTASNQPENPSGVRRLDQGSPGGTTRMNVTDAPAASCGKDNRVIWPKTAACRDPLRDGGECTSGAWAKTGKKTCSTSVFVGEGTMGESCSSLCALYKNSAGCSGVATSAGATVAKVDSSPGMRCGSLVTGCSCCEPENYNPNGNVDVSLPDDDQSI